MIKYLRKHQKKALAIVGVGLMVAFTLPSTFQGMGARNVPIGRMGDTKIYHEDLILAQRQWELLSRVALKEQNYPLTYAVLQSFIAPDQIQKYRDMYILLIREAQQMGVTVDEKQVQQVMEGLQLPETLNVDQRDEYRDAVRNLLLVRAAQDRAADAIKVSRPILEYNLAMHQQRISVNLVEIPAAPYTAGTPAPTTQQTSDYFTRFGDTDPDSAATQQNKYGFGYRFPNRLKLQYITIPSVEIRRAVEASRSAEDWEVAALRYYLRHEADYPTTQPATQPTTMGPQLQALIKKTNQPTTRPFAEVRQEVMALVMRPEIDALRSAVQNRLAAIILADWHAYQQATKGTTQPVAGPASSLGVSFGSYDYLTRLADALQKDKNLKGIKISVATTPQDQWLGAKQLAELPGIGESYVGNLDFPAYASTYAKNFTDAAPRDPKAVNLSLFELSPPLTDALENIYFFRLTDANKAHPPASLAEVSARVENDVRMAAAYDQALKSAKNLLESAGGSDLISAAKSARFTVTSTGLFGNSSSTELPRYNISGLAKDIFVDQAFKLLLSPMRNRAQQPIGIIELPRDFKLLVVELREVKTNWTSDNYTEIAGLMGLRITDRLAQEFREDWYTYANLTKRNRYKPEKTETDSDTEQPASAQPGAL